MNKLIFSFFSIFLLVFTFSFLVSAAPPFEQIVIADEGLEITAPNFDYLQQNTYHNFRFRVHNATNDVYLDDDDVNCDMGLVNNKGEVIFNKLNVTGIGYVFSVNVTSGNFSELGIYHQGINCITIDGETAGGTDTISFEVTPDGTDLDTGKSVLMLGLLIIILVLFIMTINGMIQTDDFGWTFGFLNIAYLLLNVFLFTGWKIASNYIYVIPTISVFLHGFWTITNIVWIPFILAQVAWIALKMTSESQIKGLVKKGYSKEEAKNKLRKK